MGGGVEVANVINIKNAPQGQQGILNSVGLIHYSPDPDAIFGQSNSYFYTRAGAWKNKQTRGAWPVLAIRNRLRKFLFKKFTPVGKGRGRGYLSLYKLLLHEMP